MESTYGIGETARRTGLSVSALRFYDREGVLVPAQVDPRSGYRRYTADQVAAGRLVARLRRVGLSLTDVRNILAHRDEPGIVRAVLDAHLARLEQGMAQARHELSAVLHTIDRGESAVTSILTLPAADLAAALRGVRFAVGQDPELPALNGVLLDLSGDVLRVVATDRYRLAVSTAPVARTGADRQDIGVLVPAAFADDVLSACRAADGEPARLSLGPEVTACAGGQTLTTRQLPDPFPQWELLITPRTPRQVTLDVRTVRAAALTAATVTHRREGIDYEACAFQISGDGLVWVSPDEVGDGVTLNRDFLLEALDALPGDQLVLGLDGPLTPLALASPDRPGTLSILMPVRPR